MRKKAVKKVTSNKPSMRLVQNSSLSVKRITQAEIQKIKKERRSSNKGAPVSVFTKFVRWLVSLAWW